MGNMIWCTDDTEIECMCSESVCCMILIKSCCVTRMVTGKYKEGINFAKLSFFGLIMRNLRVFSLKMNKKSEF